MPDLLRPDSLSGRTDMDQLNQLHRFTRISQLAICLFGRLQCSYGLRILGTSCAAQEHHNREKKVEDGVNYLALYWGQLGLIREEVNSFHKTTISDSKLQDNEWEIRQYHLPGAEQPGHFPEADQHRCPHRMLGYHISQCPETKSAKSTGEGIGVANGKPENPRYLTPIQNLPGGSYKPTVMGSERCELSRCFNTSSSSVPIRG